MRGYNNRMVYYYFSNPFPADFCSQSMNIHPMTIDDSSRPNKISRYTPYQFPNTTYVAYGNYVSTLATTYDSSKTLFLTYDDTNPHHTTKKYNPVHVRVKIGYFQRRRDGKICYKKPRFYC